MFSDLTIHDWANLVRGYAVTGGVVFAVILLSVWWRNNQRTQRLRREAEAKRIYASYLLQAMQHPELARPGPVDAGKGRQRAQYQWFVGYLLTVAEEILLIDASPAWRETLARQLVPHRAFLTSQPFLDGPYAGLTREVRAVIGEAIGRDVMRAALQIDPRGEPRIA